jgi:hypothetical protein
VSVQVFDLSGLSSTASGTVRVNPRPAEGGSPPVAALAITPNPATAGETVSFSAAASDDVDHDIVRYEWDVDGQPGFEQTTGSAEWTRSYPQPAVIEAQVRVTDATGYSSVASGTLRVLERPPQRSGSGQVGASRSRVRLGRWRPFSARVTGKSGDVSESALTGLGSVRAALAGSRVTKAERLMKRYLGASWRSRLSVSVNRSARSATVSGRALVTPRKGGSACVEVTLTMRAGKVPTGRLTLLGGSGSGARLYGQAKFRFQVPARGPAVILGTLRAGLGKARPVPKCG